MRQQHLGEQRGLDKVSAAQFGPAPEIEPHPGDMEYDEWSQRPDVVHHGTFEENWHTSYESEDMPLAHFGTFSSVGDRMRAHRSDVKSGYYNPRTGRVGDGVIHSRRLDRAAIPPLPEGSPGVSARGGFSDAQANGYAAGYDIDAGTREDMEGVFEGEKPYANHALNYAQGGKWDDSAEAEVAKRAVDSLDEGTPLPYVNEGEDYGSTSYVVPSKGGSSWEADYLASPNRPEHLKRGLRQTLSQTTARYTSDWSNVPEAVWPRSFTRQHVFDFEKGEDSPWEKTEITAVTKPRGRSMRVRDDE